MEIQELAKFISDFGIMIVIAALFLYIAIRVANIFLKRLEITVGNSTHDKLLDTRNDVNIKIHSLISDFLYLHSGDRIQVIEFSNSVTSVAYLPFKYMTCTYELYAVGKSPRASRIDKLSTSLFTKFFAELYDHTYILLDCNDVNPEIEHSIYELHEEEDEPVSLCIMLKTSKGKALGYIVYKDADRLTNKVITDAIVLGEKVSALLGIADR